MMNLTGTMNNKDEDLMNQIIYLMERDRSADAPADALKWAKNIFRTRAAEPKKSLVQKVLAVLQMDLAPREAAFGERSAAGSEARQVLFSAGEHSLDLRISAAGKNFSVKGQILGPGFENAEIALDSAENSYTAQINELSEFHFAKISAGDYRIALTSAEKQIVIENLKIN